MCVAIEKNVVFLLNQTNITNVPLLIIANATFIQIIVLNIVIYLKRVLIYQQEIYIKKKHLRLKVKRKNCKKFYA